ncbi:putative F-box protein At5g55150 [Rutidosis leptorrhynchoides]|uniref:putative F-box protein At5g55150 n=1 Tax=Rutidosis leptorrhynchoides TaxID=125765 RepID=UPI003A99309C
MDWSDMLTELLAIVAKKSIKFCEDDLCFSSVCKSWRSAAVQVATNFRYPNGLPSRLPSLLLAEKLEDNEFRQLYLLSNQSIHKIRLPEAYGKFCTSSCGWLLIVGDDTAIKLINPLSREIINLPRVDTFPEFSESSSKWDQGIRKVLFQSQSLVVVVLWGCFRKLGFCRIGDDKWTSIETSWGGSIYDVNFYDGRVYYFDRKLHIRSCDVYGEENKMVIVDVSRLPKEYYDADVIGAYVIGVNDDDERKRLLVVIREVVYGDIHDSKSRSETYKTNNFRVFEFDLEKMKWSKVNDFGNKTLFLGYSSSFWIEDASGVIKGNCIYYTDDVFCYKGSKKGGGRDMGIYHMCDGTVEPYFTGESLSKITPPIWLQSM